MHWSEENRGPVISNVIDKIPSLKQYDVISHELFSYIK